MAIIIRSQCVLRRRLIFQVLSGCWESGYGQLSNEVKTTPQVVGGIVE